MRLLLDTHVLIWAVQSPDLLGATARSAITASDAEVYASHVSLWEMANKRSIGRLDEIDRRASDWFDHFVPRSGLRHLPISAAHVGAVEDLPRLHGDPFDRLLVAQARHDRLTMITRDSQVAQYDIDVVW